MERFKNRPRLPDLGGARFLADLVDYAPTSTMAGHFAGMVIEAAKRRDLAMMATDIAARARAAQNPPTTSSGRPRPHCWRCTPQAARPS
jgi:replicative DNA helicase